MDLALNGKVAVVTGASTGFGRAIAVLFATHGARVVVGDVREDARPGNFDEAPELTTVELIRQHQAQAIFQVCDVSEQAQVAALVGAATARFGRLDIMVNNAGVHRGGRRIHEMTEDDLDACWRVLVKGSFFGAQEAVKAFLAQGGGGSIINIVSTAGLRGHGYQSVYNIAKAAQANLTRCLGIEYGADGVRSNGICPSFAKTAMSRGGFESEDADAMVRRVIPQGRWGEASDVANLALFLASDAGSHLNGALIPLDGGETLGAMRSA